MGKKALRHRRINCRLALIGLFLLFAGCTANNSSSDKNSGFYAGVSGGWSRP
jgi:hypothetical protein